MKKIRSFFVRVISKLEKPVLDFLRKRYLSKKRAKLTIGQKTFSLIASNCNGGFMLHDLGLPFNSPFINLWIRPSDFIKLCSSLKEYMAYELSQGEESGIDYPIGVLNDITIYFQHYQSFDEAKKKWDERKKRIDYNNIFLVFTDRDGCTEEELKEFDKLPYSNKVVFVNRPHPGIQSAKYIRGFESEASVGICFEYRNHSRKKYYDDFDYVRWINEGVK